MIRFKHSAIIGILATSLLIASCASSPTTSSEKKESSTQPATSASKPKTLPTPKTNIKEPTSLFSPEGARIMGKMLLYCIHPSGQFGSASIVKTHDQGKKYGADVNVRWRGVMFPYTTSFSLSFDEEEELIKLEALEESTIFPANKRCKKTLEEGVRIKNFSNATYNAGRQAMRANMMCGFSMWMKSISTEENGKGLAESSDLACQSMKP